MTAAEGMERLRAHRRRVVERLVEVPWVAKGLAHGELDFDIYANYLVCAQRYAKHSPVVMALAGARVIDRHPAIGSYFLHHAEEEAGHWEWARSDLRALGYPDSIVDERWPQTNAAAMIGVMHHAASVDNPVALFGWMYLLEAVGEDLGTAGAESLTKALNGIDALTFVAAHGVADADHAQEMDEVIEREVVDPADWRAVLDTAAVIEDLYVGMFVEAETRWQAHLAEASA